LQLGAKASKWQNLRLTQCSHWIELILLRIKDIFWEKCGKQ